MPIGSSQPMRWQIHPLSCLHPQKQSVRPTMSPIEKRAQAFTLFATVIVSTSFPIAAAITHGLDSFVLTLLRFALSAMILLPILAWRYGLDCPSLKDFARYAIISAMLVGFFTGMFEALRYTTPLNTATLFTLMPIIGVVFTVMMLKEWPSTRILSAVGLGLIGAVWVIYRGDFSSLSNLSLNKGDWIFLAATASMGIYGPAIKALHRGEPMIKMTFWVQVMGTVWLLLLSLPRFGDVVWADVPTTTYIGVAFLGTATAITFFIFQWSTMVLGPTRVMSFTYLNPALVLVTGLAFGHALPPWLTYPGIILAVGATVVLQLAPRKQPKT